MNINKLLFILIAVTFLVSCKPDTPKASDEDNYLHTVYKNNSLLIAHKESLIQYNLGESKIQWQFDSKLEKNQINRNYFTVAENRVYKPYGSGLIVALDIISGQTIWQQKIDNQVDDSNTSAPVFKSTGSIYNNRLYIAGSSAIDPSLYALDANTGQILQTESLMTRYNLYPPIANQYGIFINSAIYLSSYYLTPNHALSANGFMSFDRALYAPLQTEDNLLYATSETNTITTIDMSQTHGDDKLPIKWQHDYLENDKESGISPLIAVVDEQLYMASYLSKMTKGENRPVQLTYDIHLQAISPKNGDTVWKVKIPAVFVEKPQNFQVARNYFVISNAQQIAFMNKKTGQLLTNFTVDNSIPAIHSNIVEKDENTFIYLSGQNLVELNLITQTARIVSLHGLKITPPL